MLFESHHLCACFDECDFVSFDSVKDQSRYADTFSLWFCSTNEVKVSLMQIYYFRSIYWFTLYPCTRIQPIKSQLCPSMLSLWCKPFCRKNPCWAKTHIIIIYCCWILHYGIQKFPSFIDEALCQVVFHTVALPFTLKSISRQKKNYVNSSISPCKNIIF